MIGLCGCYGVEAVKVHPIIIMRMIDAADRGVDGIAPTGLTEWVATGQVSVRAAIMLLHVERDDAWMLLHDKLISGRESGIRI